MSSFYGNASSGAAASGGNSNISLQVVNAIVNKRIIISQTQPLEQQENDIWVILQDDES